MSEELKPVRCGCGGASNIVKRFSRDYCVPVWYVECIKCSIETDDYFSEAEAIQAWNTAMGATDTNVCDKFAKDINVPRKGKWPWDEEEDRCYCSECGNEDDLSIDGVYMMHDFCPNCGADMRGE